MFEQDVVQIWNNKEIRAQKSQKIKTQSKQKGEKSVEDAETFNIESC